MFGLPEKHLLKRPKKRLKTSPHVRYLEHVGRLGQFFVFFFHGNGNASHHFESVKKSPRKTHPSNIIPKDPGSPNLRWWLGCIITSLARYLGSITILSFSDWIPRIWILLVGSFLDGAMISSAGFLGFCFPKMCDPYRNKTYLSHKKKRIFHCSCCLIGILVMVYEIIPL